MLRVCDGCKDVLDTDQDGSSVGLRSPHFVLMGALHRGVIVPWLSQSDQSDLSIFS